MERRDFSLKIKSVGDAGTFTGLAAVYGNVDLGNDVIDRGAFARTLAAGKPLPLLWQHDPANPIGSVKVADSSAGLVCDGTLLLADPTAQKAYAFMKAGIIKGLSIGFDTVQATYDGDIRHLTELRLWEISCVTFPMNQEAQITAVKSLSDDDRAKHLKAIDECRKCIDRKQREIRMHLKSMLDDLDEDDDDDANPADDPALLEGNESDDDDPADEDMSKAFLVELQKFVTRVEEVAQ